MRRCFASALAVVAVLGLFACAGLAQDVGKGAGTTEREISKGTGHDRTARDGGADAANAADAADSGAISM